MEPVKGRRGRTVDHSAGRVVGAAVARTADEPLFVVPAEGASFVRADRVEGADLASDVEDDDRALAVARPEGRTRRYLVEGRDGHATGSPPWPERDRDAGEKDGAQGGHGRGPSQPRERGAPGDVLAH